METIQGIKTGIPNEIFAPLTQVRSQNGFHVVYQRSGVEYFNYAWQTQTSQFYLPSKMGPGYTFSMLAYGNGPRPRFNFQLIAKSDGYYTAYMSLSDEGKLLYCYNRAGYNDKAYPRTHKILKVVDGDYIFAQIYVGPGGTAKFFFSGMKVLDSDKASFYDYFTLDNNVSGDMRILEIHYTQEFNDRSNRPSIFGIGRDIPDVPGVLFPGSACSFRGRYSYTGSVKQPIRARMLRQNSEVADKTNKARAVDLGFPNAIEDNVNITMRVLATTVLLLVSYAKEPVSFDNQADTTRMRVSFDNINIWDAHIDTGSYIHKFWVSN